MRISLSATVRTVGRLRICGLGSAPLGEGTGAQEFVASATVHFLPTASSEKVRHRQKDPAIALDLAVVPLSSTEMPLNLLVLFCFVLFCFVLFCFVLFCFVAVHRGVGVEAVFELVEGVV